MDVGSLGTYYLAEESLLSHVQGTHLIIVVAAVFQHHTMYAVLLAQVYEFPTLFQVHGAGHLDGCMLAVLHCAFGDGEMMVPVCGDIYQVYVIALAHIYVSCFSAVYLSRGQTHLTQVFLRISGARLLIIAEGYYLHTGYVAIPLDRPRATTAKSGKSYPDSLQLG